MGALSFTILGPVSACLDGAELELGTRKQRALLALLLVDVGHVVSADRIVDQLWRGEPPAKASASLQAYVSNLRRVLEPGRRTGEPPMVLRTEAPGYRLAVDPSQVDAARFTGLAAEARRLLAADDPRGARVAADTALGCWRGAALAEFADEPWAMGAAARLDELRLAVTEDRLQAMLDLGETAAAIVDLDRLVEEHPLRERPWALLMLALYRAGRTAEALDRYQQLRRLLADELGLDPGPELQELESAILRQDDSLRPPPSARSDGEATGPPPGSTTEGARRGAAAHPTLVGRVRELQVIDDVVAGLEAADPSWLVLEGEPGIGKTRLAEELAARAARAGAAVAWGRSHEDRDAPGFWPWLQVLGELAGPAATELVAPGAEGDRFARYQRVAEALAAAAAERPALVVLDDLHWADPDSLRLLAFIAVQLRGARLAVAVTCRNAETGPELAEALATLTRRPGVVRLAVGPLEVGDVVGMAAATGTAAVDDDEAAQLHERTAGNPFLLGELLRLPPEARAGELPVGVRDVVGRRLDALPMDSRSVLALAAVIGKRFELTLLAAASGVDLDRLADLVDAALARRIVLPGEAPGEFRFPHDLLREALLAELGDVRRRRLHARIAEALTTVGSGPPGGVTRLTELARHQLDAVPLVPADVAAGTAEAAAERAEATLAFDEAVAWYRSARTVLEAAPDSDGSGERRQRLLLAEARAMALAGRVLPWRAQVAQVLHAALERGDMGAFVDGVSVLTGGGAAWLWSLSYEDPTEVIELLEQALDRLASGDDARRSRITAALAQGVYYRDGADRSVELAEEALALARRTADEQVVADALMNLAQCQWGADRVDAQLATVDELLASPVAVATVEHQLACRAIRTTLLLVRGDLTGADAEYATFLTQARRHGRRGVLSQLAWYPATRATIVGDFSTCDALMEDARRLQQSLEVYLADLIHAGATAIRCYAADDLDAIPPALLATLTEYEFGGGVIYPALIDARHGRIDQARASLHRIADFPHRFRDWLWLADMVLWADLAAAVGDQPFVHEGLEALRPYRHQFAVAGTAVGATGPVAYALAMLERASGNVTAARAAAAEGRALAEAMGAKPWIERGDRLLESLA